MMNESGNEASFPSEKDSSILIPEESDEKMGEKLAEGKGEFSLIKTILDEMKTEFNKEVSSADTKREKCKNVEKNDSSKELVQDDSANSEKADSVSEEATAVNYIDTPFEACEKSDISGEIIADDNDSVGSKTEEYDTSYNSDNSPSLTLTLKSGSEVSDGKNLTGSGVVLSSDEVWTLVKVEKPDDEGKKSSNSKRSLRSQTVKIESDNESSGVKRSARRRSKDSPRETVLQSAMARKEKSFSTFINNDEKSSASRNTKTCRSLRLSPNDKAHSVSGKVSTSKSQSDSKKVHSSKSVKLCGSNITNNQPTKLNTIRRDTHSRVTAKDHFISNTDRESLYKVKGVVARRLLRTLGPHAYTKTGKRRYKPFKGLRYSFTGGKKVKLTRKRERSCSETSQDTSVNEDRSDKSEVLSNSQQDDCNSLNESCNNLENGGIQIKVEKSIEDPPSIDSSCRSESPAIADACHSLPQKRKYQPSMEEDQFNDVEGIVKRKRADDVPSPSPVDDEHGPSKPESSAVSIEALTADICECHKVYSLAIKMEPETYCQAKDLLDGRSVGCCLQVDPEYARLCRPSKGADFLLLCRKHQNSLLRHKCCPPCGLFCTQGSFIQCPDHHYYHPECQQVINGVSCCPHCGKRTISSKPAADLSTVHPVFLHTQKAKIMSAKMSFGSAIKPEDGCESFYPLPFIPPQEKLILSNGMEISSSGMPSSLDQGKFKLLLRRVAEMQSISDRDSPIHRYTVKNLYHAAKSGHAEKLLSILAYGVNPNHLFREFSMGSALHVACASGHLTVVFILLQVGVQIDLLDRDQKTPLMLAIEEKHNDIVLFLIKAGACITLKGSEGMTSLHLAAKSGNVEACHYLLSSCSLPPRFIDSTDEGGWTPLVWAAEHCHKDVATYLLKKKADPLIRDVEQNITLHWSAFSGSAEISEMLLNYGCEVNSVNLHGDSPLHIAARQNMYHCVLLYLARGADVDLVNGVGCTPLNCCTEESTECYTAIKLNMQLKALTLKKRNYIKILSNDISRGKEVCPIQCVNSEDDEGEPRDYEYVSENCLTSNTIVIDHTITSLQYCMCNDVCSGVDCVCSAISLRCWYDDEGRLIPEFNYSDPPMLFECNQRCACNVRTCQNRVVQNGLTVRFQLFRTKGKGWGVRTLKPIRKGTYVCEYIGEIISDCEADVREDDSYLFDLENKDSETYCIDARRFGNIARFINHMCVPNLQPVRVFINHQDLHFPRIAFFANKDIEAEEELGFDYGEKFWIVKCKSFTCTCNAPTCRYSETTIYQTLENYQRRLQELEQEQEASS